MKSDQEHYRKLERMYLRAPINRIFPPEIIIDKEKATISLNVVPEYHHAAGSLHGSVYFKLLDDAAFFAAQSVVTDVFVLTASCSIELIKPVQSGMITAHGKVADLSLRKIISESSLYNGQRQLIGKGTATLVKSNIMLNKEIGYQ